MFNPGDAQKPTDKLKPPKPTDLAEKAKANVEQLTRKLERQGVDESQASAIATRISDQAAGPVANDDWMKLDAAHLKPATQNDLDQQGLTPDNILSDPDQAETYAGRVFAQEGIPDGGGGTEKVKGVVPGHYDQAGHGIDLVAADTKGNPIPIEVKKYNQPSAAHLENRPVTRLEPEVEKLRAQREAQVTAKQDGKLSNFRPDAEATWKPEIADWQKTIAQDKDRIQASKTGELPVQQMDELWTRDRWLKLIKSLEGRERLRQAGVDKKYLDYQKLRKSPDLPEWQSILDQRTTVIVSGRQGDTGKKLFLQSVAEKRSKRVVKIEL